MQIKFFSLLCMIVAFFILFIFPLKSYSELGKLNKLSCKIAKIISPKYTLIKFLGSGGESEVFLVKDDKGKLYAFKYWSEEKQHDYLRGISPFENTIVAHKKLSQAPYINHLFEVIDSNIIILEYIKGQELRDYLNKAIAANKIKEITNQILYALSNMSTRGVIGFDTSAENIMVTNYSNKTHIIFLDLGAYITVDSLYQCNKHFSANNFGIYNNEKVKKLIIKNKPYATKSGHILIDGIPYYNTPSITFYSILVDRLSLLSALLTKQYYIEKGCANSFPQYIVKERFYQSFGDDKKFFIRPITKKIRKKALALIKKAEVKKIPVHQRAKPLSYSKKDFEDDWKKMEEIFSLIVHRTKLCQKDLKKCLAKDHSYFCN